MNSDEFNVDKMCEPWGGKVLYKHTISIVPMTRRKFLEWAVGTLGVG